VSEPATPFPGGAVNRRRANRGTLGDAEIFRAKDQFGHQWQFSSQGVSTLQRENYASLTVSLLPDRDGE